MYYGCNAIAIVGKPQGGCLSCKDRPKRSGVPYSAACKASPNVCYEEACINRLLMAYEK